MLIDFEARFTFPKIIGSTSRILGRVLGPSLYTDSTLDKELAISIAYDVSHTVEQLNMTRNKGKLKGCQS